MASVVTIHRVSQPQGPAEAIEEANILADFGIEGDYRSGAGKKRQVTLVDEEVLADVASMLGMENVPAGASRRQIMVRGLRLNELIGRRLRVGEALVEAMGHCRPCERMEATIAPGARAALAGRGGLVARVIEPGPVRVGDPVIVEGE